jgi:uncharacterized phiE125 gp8 family phage protein
MGLRLIKPPAAVEPLSLDEIKQALRVDHTDDDEVLQTYMTSAREWVEKRVQAKIALETWELVIDVFPVYEIMLPFGPVVSITSIKYDDALGLEQTMPPSEYELDNTNPIPWIFAADGWPETMNTFNAVRIRFVAGYVDPQEAPRPLVAAMTLKTKELYDGENVETTVHHLLTNYYMLVA